MDTFVGVSLSCLKLQMKVSQDKITIFSDKLMMSIQSLPTPGVTLNSSPIGSSLLWLTSTRDPISSNRFDIR